MIKSVHVPLQQNGLVHTVILIQNAYSDRQLWISYRGERGSSTQGKEVPRFSA